MAQGALGSMEPGTGGPGPNLGPALLGRDYWAVISTPHPETTPEAIEQHVEDHIAWLLRLESDGTVFLSGPLTSGPDVRPGSGLTILRANSADHAGEIAAGDPFVRAGLRSFEVFGWRLNEGTIDLRLSLGTGSYHWR